MRVVLDTQKEGMEALVKPWELEALNFLWERGREGASSREVWEYVSKNYKISRASIINLLHRLTKNGVLEKEERSGKGGYHGVFRPRLDEREFGLEVVRTVLSKLKELFPEALNVVLKELAQSKEKI